MTGVSPDPSGITDEMIEAAKDALCGGGHEQFDVHVTHEDVARTVLEAALAGRTVVDLPEPDIRYYAGTGRWNASARTIVAKVDKQDRPFVTIDGEIWLVGEAESVGLALVAAARDAQQQADERSSGVAGGGAHHDQ